MASERAYTLGPDTLRRFTRKGTEGWYPAGNVNGVKVRRVMQLIRDLAKVPFNELRIRDFACGEGVYAIEAALRGANVLAFDGRAERMDEGIDLARRLGLANVTFEQADVRNVTAGSHGRADIILFLGILYHLDDRDALSVLQNIYDQCEHLVIIDTHVAPEGRYEVEHNGRRYQGVKVREHADDDAPEIRSARLGASMDNPFSFWFTRESLCRVLHDVGFTSVCECQVPLEPVKPSNRVTLIASKGEVVKLSSYPWVNDKTEEEISQILTDAPASPAGQRANSDHPRIKQRAKSMINGLLRPFGIEIRRTDGPSASATSSR
jgi:SAM-dependent methyltransferase